MKKINFKEAGMNAVGLVGGAILANLAMSKLAAKVSNPKIRAGIPLALGVVLMTQKSVMMKMAGAGMIARGGSALLGNVVPALAGVTGVGEIEGGVFDELIEGLGDEDMNGPEDEMSGVLNGYEDMNGPLNDYSEMSGVLNGVPGMEDFVE